MEVIHRKNIGVAFRITSFRCRATAPTRTLIWPLSLLLMPLLGMFSRLLEENHEPLAVAHASSPAAGRKSSAWPPEAAF